MAMPLWSHDQPGSHESPAASGTSTAAGLFDRQGRRFWQTGERAALAVTATSTVPVVIGGLWTRKSVPVPDAADCSSRVAGAFFEELGGASRGRSPHARAEGHRRRSPLPSAKKALPSTRGTQHQGSGDPEPWPVVRCARARRRSAYSRPSRSSSATRTARRPARPRPSFAPCRSSTRYLVIREDGRRLCGSDPIRARREPLRRRG
jgi:hypothetical protein